ncbi:putative 5-formyltetrahydrofolate cyclo-ligase [Sulfurospirillum halorespirans DSM 13726]|uniref:5-formyltetrahydrofolate cyclo-ligase n=2 Tax=Sulfurospirillum halorespirans TaxID=194424 RepID=A0A1D7TIT1_9BACT|nr:putative 5-formyltetrahydrofolate cyclo-ligase [Sulfurospirillum halorespirans DSM 13726]
MRQRLLAKRHEVYYNGYDCIKTCLKVTTMQKIKFETKSDFRSFARAKLNFVHNAYKRDKIIEKQILEMVYRLKARSILLYVSLPIEASTRGVIATCRRRKCNVYVPFMEGISFKMVKWRLPSSKKTFNIEEPKNSFAVKPKIDFAIVPVIGVDGAFKRIGFGKGMYDRFFASLEPKPPIAFVQREFCMTQSLICEPHDIAADIYLTPYKTIIQRGTNGLRVISGRRRCISKRRCRIFHRQKDGSCQL